MSLRILTLAGLAVLGSVASATDLGLLRGFNVVTLGDQNGNNGNGSASGGETEGAVAIRGNFSTTNAHNTNIHNNGTTFGGFTNVGMYVGGNVQVNGGQMNNGAKGLVRGNFSNSGGPYNLNGGGQLRTGGTISGTVQAGTTFQNQNQNPVNVADFTTQRAHSIMQTNHLALVTATNLDALIVDQNNLNINVANLPSLAGFSNVKVLRTNASSQAAYQNLQVNFNNQGSNTVIIDVVGAGSLNWRWKMNSSAFNKVLWNFSGLSSLTVAGDQFRGSILAPNAHVIQERNIEGNLIARSWELRNSVEMHFGSQFQFNGTAPVPEPGTMAALGLGVAALLRRRRKA